jgi:hypothetical protein
MKANKEGFANTDLEISSYNPYPEISEDIQQTLARLLAFDILNDRNKSLICDSDGRLYVSTATTPSNVAVNSAAVVGVATSQILAANGSRKQVTIQNLGTVAVYISYGTPATLATGYQIPSGGSYIENVYTGAINAISSLAAQDVRIVEI